jgi:hypothetical protein
MHSETFILRLQLPQGMTVVELLRAADCTNFFVGTGAPGVVVGIEVVIALSEWLTS